MSRTTDHFIYLNGAAEKISCLHDALKLEVEIDDSKGVTTEVQDYFRELKYDYITRALKKYDLYNDVHHYYNYSMQGYVQLFFNNTSRILGNIEVNKENLEKEWGLSLTDKIEQRRDNIVLSVEIPESKLTYKK